MAMVLRSSRSSSPAGEGYGCHEGGEILVLDPGEPSGRAVAVDLACRGGLGDVVGGVGVDLDVALVLARLR